MPVKAFILLFCVKYPISPLSTCKQFKYVVGIKCTIENIGTILVHPHVQANKNNNDEKKQEIFFFNKTDNTKITLLINNIDNILIIIQLIIKFIIGSYSQIPDAQ